MRFRAPTPQRDPTGASDERVLVTSVLPETIAITSTSVADGLLVVREPYADGSNAYVDGEEVKVLQTNHALQGVPLAAGDHTIALKYEPRSLAVGLWVTGVATVLLVFLWCLALVDWLRCGRRLSLWQDREATLGE